MVVKTCEKIAKIKYWCKTQALLAHGLFQITMNEKLIFNLERSTNKTSLDGDKGVSQVKKESNIHTCR